MDAWSVVYIVITILAVVGTFSPPTPVAYAWGIVLAVWIAMTALMLLGAL